MSPSLRLLLWLRLRGRVRMYRARLGALQSVILTIVAVLLGLGCIGGAVTAMVIGSTRRDSSPIAEFAQVWAAPAILGAWIVTLLVGGKAKPLAFTPADIDQLFPGPFQRRELVLYRICVQSFGALLSAFAFLWFILQAGTLLGGWMGCVLLTLFLQFSNIAMSIAREAGGARLRIAVGVPTVLALAYLGFTTGAFSGDLSKVVPMLRAIRDSRVVSTLLLPFEPFGRAFAADDTVTALTYAVGGFGLVLLMIVLILRLDSLSLEASLAASQKVQAALERHRRGRSVFRATAGVNVPMPRLLGRAAPIAWRHLTGVVRSGAWLLVPVGAIAGVLIAGLDKDVALPILPAFGMMLMFVLPNMLRFDFRADLDQIDVLKTLPLAPATIAAGQLAAPVLVIALMTWFLIGGVAVRSPEIAAKIAPAAIVAPLAGMLLMACENVLFLLYPYRTSASGVMDVRHLLRGMFSQFAKVLTVALGAAPAGLAAWGAYEAGLGPVGAAGAAGLVLAVECVALVFVLAWAFTRFDPARDMPA